MPIKVEHPVLGTVEFPDDYSMEQIDRELLEIGSDILPEDSALDVFINQGYEGLTSSIRGVGQLLGLSEQSQADYIDEFNNRVQLEQSPVAGYSGLIAGSILDPVTLPVAWLKPIAVGSKVATGLARGSVAGATGGAIEPTYDEFGDSRLFNVAGGAVLGGGIGAAVGKFAPRAIGIDEPTPEAPTPEAPRVIDETPAQPEAQMETVGGQSPMPVAMPLQPTVAPAPTPKINDLPTARSVALNEVRENLSLRAKYTMPNAEVEKVQRKISNMEKEINRVNKEVPSVKVDPNKKQKFQKAPVMKKRVAHIEKLKARIQEERNKLTAHEQGLQAKRELQAIKANKVTPFVTSAVEKRAVELVAPAPTTKAPEPAPQVAARIEAEQEAVPVGFDRLPDAKQSMGARLVDPVDRILPEAQEGVDPQEQLRSVTTTKKEKLTEAETDTLSQGFEMSHMDVTRQAIRARASQLQFSELMPRGRGDFNFEDAIQEAEELLAELGDDYDNLIEWAVETWQKKQSFNAYEQIVFNEVIVKSKRVIDQRSTDLRALKRRDELDTQEGLDAFHDLQVAAHMLNIDRANRKAVSNALSIMRVTNERRKGINKAYKKGQIKDQEVMFFRSC